VSFRELLLSPFVRQLVQRLKDPSKVRLHAAILVEGPHMNVDMQLRRTTTPGTALQAPAAASTHMTQRHLPLPPPLSAELFEFPGQRITGGNGNGPDHLGQARHGHAVMGSVGNAGASIHRNTPSASLVLSNYILFVIKTCVGLFLCSSAEGEGICPPAPVYTSLSTCLAALVLVYHSSGHGVGAMSGVMIPVLLALIELSLTVGFTLTRSLCSISTPQQPLLFPLALAFLVFLLSLAMLTIRIRIANRHHHTSKKER